MTVDVKLTLLIAEIEGLKLDYCEKCQANDCEYCHVEVDDSERREE